MWDVVEHKLASGEWINHATFDSVSECQKQFPRDDDQTLFYLYSGPLSDDANAVEKTYNKVLEANNNRNIKMVVGARISVEKIASGCKCPGRCYCVMEKGKCWCEAIYCDQYKCWIIPCAGSCSG